VEWQVSPEAERAAEKIPSFKAEVLFYAAREAMRNAAHHGRGEGSNRPLHLRVRLECRDGLEILIEDNGVGIGTKAGPERSSGQGLALHSTLLAVIGGSLAIESPAEAATRARLWLPDSAW
jgi:signal transduction histidine kinase